MTARFNSIGDIWNNTAKTTIQTGAPITSDPKLTQITELMSAFSNGEINFSTLKARLASLDITVNGATTRASFTYRGKTYSVQQRTSAYSNTKFSSSTLRDIYKLTDEQINTYFTKKSETEYELNKSSGCKTISAVLAKVAQQYQNDMLLVNFLNDKNKTTNRITELRNTSDNKTINSYNYQDYIDEIQSSLGTDTDAAKKKALDKFITDFTQGNVAYSTVTSILKAIGVEYKLLSKGNNVGIQFTYDNKTYQLSCKLIAAIQGTDDKTVETYSADSLIQTGATQTLINKYFDSVTTVDGKAQTYALKSYVTYAQFLAEVEKEKTPKTFSYSELKNTYKFTDDIINKYFKKEETANARPQSGRTTSGVNYVLNTEAGCKTIAEVEQKMAEQYQKAMVLVNFLNDKNKKTDVVNDMKKAGDGNTITKDNYQKYVDEIKQALGNDEDAIVEKALEKLVKDFTEGNISMNMVSTIADAMGIDSSKAKFSRRGNELGYEIEYKGKTYTMFCMIDALTSGTDDKSLQTYTLSDLQKTEATEEQINKYFYAATIVDGKTTTYHMRSNYTYAQFEEEVKASQKKNGVETSRNAQGYKVETTYVDGVVTKVVEYKYDGKSVAKETEYFANGQVKHETKYVSYSDKKEAETEFYENGKTKSETTYDYYGPTTKEYDEKGTLKIETAYDYYGKNVTTYNSDGSTVKTSYDKNTNNPTKEVRTSANGIESYFAIEVADDGSKTVTEHSDGKYMSDYNRVGVEKYDAQGRLTYKSKYQSTYSYTDTKYIYNEDGSRREISYDSHSDNTHGDITSDKTYDKNGRLIKTATYGSSSSKRQDLPDTEVSYTYDSNGAILTTTTTKYDIEYDRNKKTYYQDKTSETVTDKNGSTISEIKYNALWTDPTTGTDYKKGLTLVTTYDGTKKTITATLSGKKLKEITTDSATNTQTIIAYNNGIISSAKTTDGNNNVLEDIKYDSAGNLSSKVSNEYQNGKLKTSIVYDKNGNIQTKTVYEYSADGNTITAKVYDSKGNLKSKTVTVKSTDKNGREKLTNKNYDNSDKLLSTVNSYYSNDGKERYEDTYDATKNNGMISNRKVYDSYDNVKRSYNYTYQITDSKNYTRTQTGDGNTVTTTVKNGVTTTQVTKKSNGDIYTEYFDEKTGKHTKSFYYTKSNGTVKTTEYNANGNALGSAKSRIPASDAIKGETTKIYEAIANVDGRMYFGISNLTAIKMGGAGDITIKLLRMAAKNYNGTPSGATKLNSTSQIEAKYRDYATNSINTKLAEFGYTADQVKGYMFSNTSDVAKKMAGDSDLKNYIKANIKALVNGQDVSNIPLNFESDKDLYNAFHGTNVVDSSLSGTKLTLTIMDVYDFDPNAKGTNNGAKLNRIAAAAMKDGEIKPYYTITKVTVDLTSLGFTAAQIQAMKS